MAITRILRFAAFVALSCCGSAAPPLSPANPGALPPEPPAPTTPTTPTSCGTGQKLRVHFYDVGQALSALVELPDGRHVLVDTGDSAKHPGCGPECTSAHESLMSKLAADLAGRPIDLLWITHQHSDHIGGAVDVLRHLPVRAYVDNGRDLSVAEIKETRAAATSQGVPITVVEPGQRKVPLSSTADVRISAIAPSAWLPSCNADRNECSILLRVDYCASSILFTGDAEKAEEALLDTGGPVTLVQIGHHGSDTSSSPPFIARLRPKYAVISAGKPGDGMNRTYCHPRVSTVKAVTAALGGPGSKTISAFDAAVSCKSGTSANWVDVPASDQLWATERDGDLWLTTVGDGTFVRE